jgi:hypothetical protein
MAANAMFICLGYELDDRGTMVRFQVWAQLLLFNTAFTSNLRITQLPAQWVPGTLCPEIRQAESENDHLPPSSV